MALSRTHTYRFGYNDGVIVMSKRSWWKDLIALIFAGLISFMSYAVVISGEGVMPIAGVVITGMISILLIYGVDVQYVKVGRFELRMRQREDVTVEYDGDDGESNFERLE